MPDELMRERLALLGSLMAGLAHEVKSPVAAICSNSELLRRTFERLEQFIHALPEVNGARPAEAVEDLLALIPEILKTQQIASEQLDNLVRNIRGFVRSETEEWKRTSLRKILEDALLLTAHTRQTRIKVSKDFGQEIEIDCHPSQLSQVFINILINASQAIEGTGEIHIKTSLDASDSRLAVVTISDTGCGMSQAVQARIFDLGFTTKPASIGTGLGLSISRGIVQNHKGRIDVISEERRGSTFVVTAPVTQTA